MTDTPNFRALAQELNTLLVYVASTHPDLHQTVRRAVLHCSDRARQELATPPPEPPTDEELWAMGEDYLDDTDRTYAIKFARAALERWGK